MSADDSDILSSAPTLDQLTALVFELASQLHVERIRRIALEAALERTGTLAPGVLEGQTLAAEIRPRAAEALERAMAGIMRVLTENADARTPLRNAGDLKLQSGSAP